MKTFQGVITNWYKNPLPSHKMGLGYRIVGTCSIHMDKPAVSPAAAALRATIQEREHIFTSYVESITNMDGFYIVETKNSRYILIGEPRL